ncbi:HDOD domain-containing protein [endosymbiont of unidentified scaly snail isolate Monju]|uniref:HDOD domain-containing protein n=1 Tax=endosymbiont of unidentified scaly snail isolate Monju TaxID=1248727 RepID=UPI0009E05FCE|nr:HDOD domain-containing protein [endosymbiont of unidentified scaly snail isolate Monju]
MPEPGIHPSPSVLAHFQRFQALSPVEREDLARQLRISTAKAGTRLLELGSTENTTLYLLEGEVELRASDGHTRIISADDPAARMPISRLRPSLYRVTARTPVKYIRVSNQLLEDLLQFERASSIIVDENYLVEESETLLNSSSETLFISSILSDLEADRLAMESPPEVGAMIGRAILDMENDPEQIAQALMVEPVLSAKLIRAANHATGRDRIDHVGQAVRQLGYERTISIVFSCVLRETLRSRTPAILAAMRSWWERSLRVSAIAYVLARLGERLDPDVAASAGLLHRLGVPVLLTYVNRTDRKIDARSLKQAIDEYANEVTRLIASMWPLGFQLRHALHDALDPMRDHNGPADYADVVIVADRHADIGQGALLQGPSLDEMPAVARLGLRDAPPEISLRIMEAANGALNGANHILEG